MSYTTHKLFCIQQKRVRSTAQEMDSYSFFNLLTSDKLLQVVEDKLPEHRERLYTPTTTLSMFLAQAMNTDSSCQKIVNTHAIERIFNGLKPCSSMTGAYCRARKRLPLGMVSDLVKQTGTMILQNEPNKWKWKGRHVKLVDGTTVTMPDTEANQRTYPQQNRQAPGIGYPIARMVAIISLSTGVILDGSMGPIKGKGGSEHALFRGMLDSLDPGDIVVADRYYCSYFMIAMLLEKGVDVVFRQHRSRKTDFRKGRRLSAKEHIVDWTKPVQKPKWMSDSQYDQFPETLRLREFKSKDQILVTSLLSSKYVTKQELSDVYKKRWNIELDLRNIKTTLGMESLSCQTPQMNEKEMWVYFLAYNLIRLLMAESAIRFGILPRQISFKHTLQLWTTWNRQPSPCYENQIQLFALIAANRTGNRPGRVEPRRVKRRPKPYTFLMQPRESAREYIKLHGHPIRAKT